MTFSIQEQPDSPSTPASLFQFAGGAEGQRRADETKQFNLQTAGQLGSLELKRSDQDQTKAGRTLEVSGSEKRRHAPNSFLGSSPS